MPYPDHIYWIKFRDNENPYKYKFESSIQMMDELFKLQSKHGWIEWMQRD